MKAALSTITLIFCFAALAQKDMMLKPDSMSNTRFPKMYQLGDSANYFYVKGDSISYHLHALKLEEFERGKIYRWTDTIIGGLHQYHFYIVKRKRAFKGSLTVDLIQLSEKNYKMRVRNSFESYDRTIYLSDIGTFPIILPKKKVLNPSKKK